MDKTFDFIVKNFKVIAICITFFVGLYVQHRVNTQRITNLEIEYKALNTKLDSQYQKIDAIKLDKSVFEASLRQFQSMGDDIREIRDNLNEVLENKK